MGINVRTLTLQVLIVVFCLGILETISCQIMRRQDETYLHDLVDPLLGYSVSEAVHAQTGYSTEMGFVVFTSCETECSNPARILITGGSTSDVVLDRAAWPIHVPRLLAERNVCARIYAGGVAGYNTGQEVLQLLRDGLNVEPHLHVSYSGANDYGPPEYVSGYEQGLFRDLVHGRFAFPMPNTMRILTKELGGETGRVALRKTEPMAADRFWKRNLRVMHGIALSHGYEFQGVLQPVIGSGLQTVDRLAEARGWPLDSIEMADMKRGIELYEDLYPHTDDFVDEHYYVADLRRLFDDTEDLVFESNCHLEPKYQEVVAEAIVNLIVERMDPAGFDTCHTDWSAQR